MKKQLLTMENIYTLSLGILISERISPQLLLEEATKTKKVLDQMDM